MYGNAAYYVVSSIPVVYRLQCAAVYNLVILNLKSLMGVDGVDDILAGRCKCVVAWLVTALKESA